MIKDASTYEIMTPESVGLTASNLVMGKHSGRAAFRQKLEELGYKLGDNEIQDALHRFKALADAKKHVYDEDIRSEERRVGKECFRTCSSWCAPNHKKKRT